MTARALRSLGRGICGCLVALGLAAPATALAAPAPAQAAAAAPAVLEADLARLLDEEALTGMVWATVDGDRTTVGAAGLADAARGTPLAPDARVHVGSVAKTLLALAILRRVTDGALDLDAEVAHLLPGLPVQNRWADGHPLRLRHLIDMTGGLDDMRLWQIFSAVTDENTPLDATLRRDAGALRLRTPPGRQFSYSNLSFTLAGRVLEASVGERYESWADRELLRPLGMNDSTFGYATPTAAPARAPTPTSTPMAGSTRLGDPRLAWGHLDDGTPTVAQPWAVRPAAQFITTAADMARLARFLMGDGRAEGRLLIAPELLGALGRPTTTDAARAGLRTGYGLGLFTRDRHDAVGLCHGGSVGGYRAMFCLYPEQHRAYFAAHNADVETADYGRFDARFVQHLGAELPEPSAAGMPPAIDHGDWSGRYVPAPSRLSQAALVERLFGTLQFSVTADGANLQQAGQPPRRLLRVGDRLYRQEDRRIETYALLRDDAGRPLLASGMQTLRRIGALEYFAPWSVVAAGIAGLLWWLVVPPWQRVRRSTSLRRAPAFWAVLAVLAGAAALAMQPWERLGDLTVASALLASATAALPLALLAQLVIAARDRRAAAAGAAAVGPAAAGAAAVGAAAAALALCLLLAAFGLLPLVLWRL